jgi:hypothetical protein
MPARFALTAAQHEQIQVLLELGTAAKEIGRQVCPSVSYNAVLKLKRNLHSYGSTVTPRLVPMGRPAIIREDMAQVAQFPRLFCSE